MEIAYVYDACHPWETGGVQTRLWELGRRLGARGHDVHWYGLHYWDGPATIERDGITFHGVMEPRELYVDGRRSIPEALQYAANLVRPLWRSEADIIDCQEFPYFPAFSSKLGAVTGDATLLLTWHEVWGRYWHAYLGRVKGTAGRAVERLTATLPDVHVAVSELAQRDVARFGAEARLLPNGVDTDAIAAVDPVDRDIDVAFVGRLIEQKGADLVVEAIDQLWAGDEAVTCEIVGDGPERDRLRELVETRGLEDVVTLRGEITDHEEVLGLLKAAEVYVLPSRREGFGITVLEALACGTPVVTAQHPRNAATALVTEGETGAIREPTPDGIADGIRTARGYDAAACRTAAADYDWGRLVDEAEALYRSVL